ncbi:tRNA (guanine-N1)-methyltransferase [Nitrosococcus halophilus Nc 4]|uniref:tRNA (guanine-N(1)-)-methyltransferase n=1 Tax=Nitrosococcus halophilus (strain Nc4) TaxID=472759 RepID=D5BYB8_NITHN|nr:tRNA (guanosine(37)-N1)-methyltransferase TrmD [Nitrosococcus halophilus]ADE14101.1 tRNA (guanine-N1)-methyltransferase [Nitrosococcus halophilus Nc 4]
MRLGVVTLFPSMFDALWDSGVIGRALKQGIVGLSLWNPRDFTHDRHRTVDDRPYGGGPGMVMGVQPLHDAIHAGRAELGEGCRVLYLSPQGRRLDQAGLEVLATQKALLFVAGRYEGVDERLMDMDIDEEWSIGDYVLSGGELAAMVMIDGLVRLLPGALGATESAQQDSFVNGLLDCPHYTRPEVIEGRRVPSVLLSGNHEAIRRWRLKQALGRTWLRRPDLLSGRILNLEQQHLLAEFIREYQAEYGEST